MMAKQRPTVEWVAQLAETIGNLVATLESYGDIMQGRPAINTPTAGAWLRIRVSDAERLLNPSRHPHGSFKRDWAITNGLEGWPADVAVGIESASQGVAELIATLGWQPLCEGQGTANVAPDGATGTWSWPILPKGIIARLRNAAAALHDGTTERTNTKSMAKGGRKSDPEVAKRDRAVAQMFDLGKGVDDVCERYDVSADTARRIRSDAKLGRRTFVTENDDKT